MLCCFVLFWRQMIYQLSEWVKPFTQSSSARKCFLGPCWSMNGVCGNSLWRFSCCFFQSKALRVEEGICDLEEWAQVLCAFCTPTRGPPHSAQGTSARVSHSLLSLWGHRGTFISQCPPMSPAPGVTSASGRVWFRKWQVNTDLSAHQKEAIC